MNTANDTIDKSTWGEGPWLHEPDREEFRHLGLACLIRRNPMMGNWCGYVAMPPGHRWHGMHYDECLADVHGGLTYSDRCQGSICHVPREGEPDDVWWLGFDCGHCDDLAPGHEATMRRAGIDRHGYDTTYRDIDFARATCRSLAAQALAFPESSAGAG